MLASVGTIVGSSGGDEDASTLARAGFRADNDFDVAVQSREEMHQPLDGKPFEAVIRQRGNTQNHTARCPPERGLYKTISRAVAVSGICSARLSRGLRPDELCREGGHLAFLRFCAVRLFIVGEEEAGTFRFSPRGITIYHAACTIWHSCARRFGSRRRTTLARAGISSRCVALRGSAYSQIRGTPIGSARSFVRNRPRIILQSMRIA